MDWNLISIIAVYSLIALFFIKNRKKIERQGIMILYRTKRGLNFVSKLAKKFNRFWRIFGKVSIYSGFVGIFAILALLAYNAINIILNPTAQAGVALAVPGVRIPGSPIFIPFWYGIIALIIVLVVHEGCHGLIAKAHGLKLKSAGIGLLAFLPLAFVEPDEKQLEKAPLKTRLAVFGAGPLANLSTALIVVALTAIIAPISGLAFESGGLNVLGVTEGLPAEQAGLSEGDTILSINNISNITIAKFTEEMDETSPGETVEIETLDNNFTFETTENPENKSQSYMGITFEQKYNIKEDIKATFGSTPWIFVYLIRLFNWVFMLNLGIGAINYLPLGPIDGGRMLKDTLKEKMKNKKRAKQILKFFSYFSLFLLLINIIGPYIMSSLV